MSTVVHRRRCSVIRNKAAGTASLNIYAFFIERRSMFDEKLIGFTIGYAFNYAVTTGDQRKIESQSRSNSKVSLPYSYHIFQ